MKMLFKVFGLILVFTNLAQASADISPFVGTWKGVSGIDKNYYARTERVIKSNTIKFTDLKKESLGRFEINRKWKAININNSDDVRDYEERWRCEPDFVDKKRLRCLVKYVTYNFEDITYGIIESNKIVFKITDGATNPGNLPSTNVESFIIDSNGALNVHTSVYNSSHLINEVVMKLKR